MTKSENDKYRAKILKFPKEIIVDAAIFACFGADRIYIRCVEYEHERLMKQTDKLENQIKALDYELKAEKDGIKRIKLYKQIRELRDKQFAIFDKMNKLFTN